MEKEDIITLFESGQIYLSKGSLIKDKYDCWVYLNVVKQFAAICKPVRGEVLDCSLIGDTLCFSGIEDVLEHYDIDDSEIENFVL